ncbi:MAG: hypothetical protein LAO78_03805 [Acidobacteriia bacterium]|nr:hypothetical protein [Terriglobia bacterium]
MPEIDPQSDPRLTDALRRMAASSRQGAPAEIGAGLVTAFRRHHTRRRRIRLTGAAALVACIALIAGLVSMRASRNVESTTQSHVESSTAPGKTPEATEPQSVKATNAKAVQPVVTAKRVRPNSQASRVTAGRQFLALPGYDPAVPADELHVVRVRLPASALWQMGAPMIPDGDGRRVLADFVVSQDGTPYAVRLVQ